MSLGKVFQVHHSTANEGVRRTSQASSATASQKVVVNLTSQQKAKLGIKIGFGFGNAPPSRPRRDS